MPNSMSSSKRSPDPLKTDYSNLETQGRFVIEASAGTGKTYSILRIYLRYLLDRWKKGDTVDIDQLLLVTFTNAATQELRERLLEFLQDCYSYCLDQEESENEDNSIKNIIDQSLSKAPFSKEDLAQRFQAFLTEFDRAPVYTIHAFCGRVQTEWFPQVGLPIESRNRLDSDDLLEEVCMDYWRRWMHAQKPSEQRIAKYLKQRFGSPIATGAGFSEKSLLKEIKGIQRYLNIELKPEPIEWSELNLKLEELEKLFYTLTETFEQHGGQPFIFEELQKAKKSKDNSTRSRLINNFFYGNLKTKVDKKKHRLHFGSASKLIEDSKNKDHQPAAWTYELDSFLKTIESLEKLDQAILSRILLDLHQNIQSVCKRESLTTHDLDIKLTLQGLQRKPQLAQKLAQHYGCILVDEFQDTDKIQYEIFDRIYRAADPTRNAMYFIGDPKQSIYRFRNADIHTYIRAKQQADTIYTLKTNYRSSTQAVEAVNTLFKEVQHPTSAFDEPNIPFDEITAKGTKEQLQCNNGNISTEGIRLIIPDESSVDTINVNKALQWIALEIERYLDPKNALCLTNQEDNISTPIKAKDIAVLVNKHKDAQLLKEILSKRNISSVLYSRPSVFASDEARWLTYLFEAMLEPKNQSKIKRALTTPFFSIDAQRFIDWAQQQVSMPDLLAFQKQFEQWRELWSKKSTLYVVQHILESDQTRARIVGLEQGDRSLTNILQLAEHLSAFEEQKKASAQGVIHYLQLKRQRATRNEQDEEDEVRLDTDDELVKIMTVFRAKGLEFPIVFTALNFFPNDFSTQPWIEAPTLHTEIPTQIPNNPLKEVADELLIGKDRNLDAKMKVMDQIVEPTLKQYQEIEEAREAIRKFYVALTRAKYQTITVEYKATKSNKGPIIPAHLLLAEEQKKSLRSSDKGFNNPLFLTRKESYTNLNQLAQNSLKNLSIESASADDILFRFKELAVPNAEHSVATQAVDQKMDSVPDLPKDERRAQWKISSYSGLSNYLSKKAPKAILEEEEDAKDRDESASALQTSPPDQESTLFDFDKGAHAGSFMHELYETLEFHRFEDQNHRQEVIDGCCKKFGYDPEKWSDVLHKMLLQSMRQPLKFGTTYIQLGQLQPNQILREMEFLFDHSNFDLKALLKIIRPNETEIKNSVPALKGFLKGFIDLCFMHNNKVYILDYKSNYLGHDVENYESTKLKNDLEKHYYDLQYHIYAYALDRVLSSRIADYSYQTHFGGVCYMYLRGLQPNSQTGVFTTPEPRFDSMQRIHQLLASHP